MVEGRFEQTTTALGFLRSILGRYPFSIGFIREIEQNADDAKASSLILVLDTRRHPTTSLLDENLSSIQGPALLAFNDAKFDEKDWHALQYAYESSKADNSSKIGKYGVGFRSVFHVTDCPQIISDDNFAMFDPCQIGGSTGIRKDLSSVTSKYPHHLTPFGYFQKSFSPKGFEGTVIRCPLRTKPSPISSKVVQTADISELFRKFIKEEIEISLLFLKNLQKLEIHEIGESGTTCLATLSVSRSPVKAIDAEVKNYVVTTITTTFKNSEPFVKTKLWNIIDCPFSENEAVDLVSKDFLGDATSILKHHKLLPHIRIAFPQDLVPAENTSGRLFTFLPLPIFTGFPVHIHAPFALTESRQSLRNPLEIGLVDGSDDQMLIKWNRLLFDHYIPLAWQCMLEFLVQSEKEIDVLAAWPPSQSSATSGEAVYWQSLPSHLLDFLASSKSPTWPVYIPRKSNSSIAKYLPLDLLITAPPTTASETLDALTRMGLDLLRPPPYIYELIKNAKNMLLTPEVAHHALLKFQECTLQSVSKEDRSTVLEYLLENKDVANLVGLPLITISNGQIVSLSANNTDPANIIDTKTHVMLDSLEYEIFGPCDDNAIPLQNFSFRVADIFRTRGPMFLNVENLDVHHIVNYLDVYPSRMGLDLSLIRVDQRTINWLSTFWIWMATYEKKQDLFTQIRHLYILPSTQGLRTADQALFRALKEHPTLVESFGTLGISFLDSRINQIAHNVIESFDLLKRIIDVHAVLDLLPETISPGAQSISYNACLTVLRHLGTYAPASCAQYGPFSEAQIQRIKTFPIFPIASLPPSNRDIIIELTPIPEGVSLISIENSPKPPFLPSLPDRRFIQLNKALAFLDHLDPTAKRFTDMDILMLTVDNFLSQENYIQAATLEFICHRQKDVPPIVIENLRKLAFVPVKDGSRQKPIDVIDPASKLAQLYEETPGRLVRESTDTEKKFVRALQRLRLMQRDLTTAIAQERIDFISASTSSNAMEISRSLLSLIISSRLDCSGLEIAPDKRWLPTNQGLRSSAECRDPSLVSPSLFDQVLSSFESFKIPSSLKNVLGWNHPLPIEVVIKQLDQVLQNENNDHTFSTVANILKELSSLACDPVHFSDLGTATFGKKWVPTTDHQLTEMQNAVLDPPIPESGFHQALCPDLRMREFLARMGCANKPTVEAIIANLNTLKSEPMSLNIVTTSLNILKSLSGHVEESERSRLLVPDVTSCLQPFDNVYFNDIGDHAKLITSETIFIAHPLLEESLAIQLGLGRLGLHHEEFSVPHIDMGQDIVTTIRNNLKLYTDQQIATEFLANALDAKATEFSLLVNKYCVQESESNRCLSETMKIFCTCPSLVIHNNSKFSDADFIGICRTGIGGKDGDRETIGHFGLGALTMFHLAELALIVSNTSVLFLSPSKEHLPVSNFASLMLPLNRVRKFYTSHLASVDGLFGFDISSDQPYEGTMFILPLRIREHFETSSNPISRQIYTTEMLELEIVENFRPRAPNCFLFTNMTKIDGLTREGSGQTQILWSFGAHRAIKEQETETGCLAAEVMITRGGGTLESRWTVVTENLAEDAIPQQILSPLSNYRLRIPVVLGLAFSLEHVPASQETRSSGFFSTLPLGIETSLPCHVMGTFILSSDRRSIRLDEYGKESQFNTWLLSDALPRLYLFLLQVSLEYGDNKKLWPGRHHGKEDAYSRILSQSFYSNHLRPSGRRVFYNAWRPENPLTPQQVVLSGEEPPNIEKLLSKLECEMVIRPPKPIYQLMASESGLQLVNPSFVKTTIINAPSFIFSEWDFKVIEDCILYLLGREGIRSNLLGLGIIPLEDGTFGTFQERSDPDIECYYIWMPHKSSKRHNFSTKQFVHPNLRKKVKEELLKMDLNVLSLDTSAIRNLIGETFTSHLVSDLDMYRTEVSARLSNWIYEFWEAWPEYARLDLSYNDISCFPLVPTVRPSWFTTLSSCQNRLSVLVNGDSEHFEDIRYILDKLDVNVIRLSSDDEIPFALATILKKPEYPIFNIQNVLKALCERQHSTSFVELLHECDSDKQRSFATWARGDIKQTVPAELQSVAQQLPIWPSARRNSMERNLRPASDIHMLPEGLDFDVTAQFMSVCVAEYGSLQYFDGPKLNYAQVQARLDLPEELTIAELEPYRNFLELSLPRLFSEHGADPILIPNGNRVMQQSDTLYARDDLFEMAFGTNSLLFIHQDFEHLEDFLTRHGLKRTSNLDIDMFVQCANAFEESQTDSNNTNEQIARANVLFDAYAISLPMYVPIDQGHRWSELDDLCFIPRNMTRRRLLRSQDESVLGLEIPPRVSNLPTIVSPTDLVREEFEAAAWTQRGTFARQPDQRVILAYPDLGQPSISEVIAHVRYLSKLPELSHSQRQIVVHDLEASYRFLNDNSTGDPNIPTIGNENIFLNVNDPNEEEWKWDKAEELVFERHDMGSSIRHVRNFLSPFRRLLEGAGALQVYYPEYTSNQAVDTPNAKLLSIRSGYQKLREGNLLTDVMFLPEDDDEDETSDSEPLMAHRSFLAVNTDYFFSEFAGGYQEGRATSTNEPIQVRSPHSKGSTRLVLDYIYKGDCPTVDNLPLHLVLDILRLSGYWGVSDLFEYMQREIALKLLQPEILHEVRTSAETTGAENLRQACVTYEEKNQVLVTRFSQT